MPEWEWAEDAWTAGIPGRELGAVAWPGLRNVMLLAMSRSHLDPADSLTRLHLRLYLHTTTLATRAPSAHHGRPPTSTLTQMSKSTSCGLFAS